MLIDDNIRTEKLQYNINREEAKISPSSSGKVGKYKYLTDEEILSSDQSKIIEEARLMYSLLEKVLEKQKQLKMHLKNKHKRFKIELKNKS